MRLRALVACLLLLLTGLVSPAHATAATTLFGPDVARYQHPDGDAISWSQVRKGGSDFTFVKATESTTYTNPYFAQDWKSSAAAGLFHGAYHYARPGSATAVAQADYFAKTIGPQNVAGTLPPVLDLEDNGGLTPTSLQAWVKSFLTELKKKTGRTPMIYTYPSFWQDQMAGTTAFTSYPLWIANYNVSKPANIGWPAYTFWQYTSTGSTSGISGQTDISRFNGTQLDLDLLALTGTWKPATKTVADTASTSTAASCGAYVPVTPQRILDTRGDAPVNGSRTFTLPASVPLNAVSVELDVSAVEATGAGYLRVAAAGVTPTTTAVTYGANRSATGLVMSGIGSGGQITVTSYGTAVDVTVDLLAYDAPGGSSQWSPITPTRVADTRTGQGLPQGETSSTLDLDLSKQVPKTATGVVLDLSAVHPGGAGYVRLAAAGQTPTTTALNFDHTGDTTSLVVTAATNGHVTVSVNGAPTHLVVDLLGWFDSAVTSGGSYCALAPTRFLDTRTGLGATGPGTGPLAVSLPDEVPASAVGVVLDVSAVAPTKAGYVRLTAPGLDATTTALNTTAHRSVTGLVVVPVKNAQVEIAAYRATTDLVLDVVGYLGPPPASGPAPTPSPTTKRS